MYCRFSLFYAIDYHDEHVLAWRELLVFFGESFLGDDEGAIRVRERMAELLAAGDKAASADESPEEQINKNNYLSTFT